MTRVRQGARAGVLLVAGALLFAALGTGTVKTSSAGAATTTTKDAIVIRNFMFYPATLKVLPGALIRVTNRDSVEHTVTAVHHQFNTYKIAHNRTKYFRAPKKAGTYHYICNIHQFMTGTIVVK